MSTCPVRISGIILAAGLSRRAAPHNKLLLMIEGRTVVRAVAEAFVGAGLDEVIVVTGHDRDKIEAVLKDLPVRFVFAKEYARGMGLSLSPGIQHASPEAQGFLVAPADLPHLTPALVRSVAEAFRSHGAMKHIIPTYNGARGHPAVVGSWLRTGLEALNADFGARALLAEENELARTCFLPVDDPAILRDVDDGVVR